MAELTKEQLLMSIIAGRGAAYLRGVNLSKLDLSNVGWLVEADLREANMMDVNLTNANLNGSVLRGANLRKANCMKANLENVDLQGAKLNVTNLQKANLRNSNLQSASLVGANLSEADLSGANLESTNFDGANLDRVNFEGANFGGAAHRDRIMKLSALLTDQENRIEEIDEYEVDAVEIVEMEDSEISGFFGRVNSIQLSDLLQMVCLSKSSFNLLIRHSQEEGKVHVLSGQIAHAQYENFQGEAALFKILEWPYGTFETHPPAEQRIVTIKKPWEHLLIEAVRRIDEMQAVTPPSDSETTVPNGYTGILKDIQLTDLIQMVCLSRADLLVSIQSKDERHGTIYVRSGRLEHALTNGNLQGEQALFEMLRWDHGRFETIPYEGSGTVSINKPWEHLLIEGMRQRDEDSLH